MPSAKTILLASLLALVSLVLPGCAKNDFDAGGYDAVQKHNRLYLFVHGSKAQKSFEETGEFTPAVTRIAKGPNGMTIVAEPDVNIDKYLDALGARVEKDQKKK